MHWARTLNIQHNGRRKSRKTSSIGPANSFTPFTPLCIIALQYARRETTKNPASWRNSFVRTASKATEQSRTLARPAGSDRSPARQRDPAPKPSPEKRPARPSGYGCPGLGTRPQAAYHPKTPQPAFQPASPRPATKARVRRRGRGLGLPAAASGGHLGRGFRGSGLDLRGFQPGVERGR